MDLYIRKKDFLNSDTKDYKKQCGKRIKSKDTKRVL